MSRKSSGRSIMAIGTPSAILVFVLLCLTSFGALAFSTAGADLRLSVQTAKSTADYYSADEKAQLALMKVDETLEAVPGICETELAELLKPLADTAAVTSDGAEIEMTFAYGACRALHVAVKLLPDSQSRYEITDYTGIMINEPKYGEESLNIWEGAQ